MSDPIQLPGNLPPGATLDSFLTKSEFATWQRIAPTTAERTLRLLRRNGVVTGKRDFRIHPRTYLHSLGPKFKEALSV